MMTAFSLSLDEAQWVITAYMIAGRPDPDGRLVGKPFQNRTIFLVSLGAFVVSSGLCGLAWNGPSLVIFRVLRGWGRPHYPMAMVFLVMYSLPTSGAGHGTLRHGHVLRPGRWDRCSAAASPST
jgi:DHA2 family multidrug resistance protein